MKMGHQVSVVIPCHNDGRYLTQAVDSVLAQVVADVGLEILIVNDRSSDPFTLEVLSRLEATHREIQVINHTGCPGPAAARNAGIAAARGEWIAFLDADDVWLPEGLLARWQAVESIPDAEWIGADFVYWYEDGRCDQAGCFKTHPVTGPLVRRAYQSEQSIRFERPVREFLEHLLTWTSTVLVKKSLLERVGGFDERLKGPEDFHLWIRLAQVTDFHFVPVIVARYRQHKKSLMNGPVNIQFHQRRLALRLLLLDSVFEPYRDAIEDNLTRFHLDTAYDHLACGEKWLAIHYAAMAVLRKPLWTLSWKTFLYVTFFVVLGLQAKPATPNVS